MGTNARTYTCTHTQMHGQRNDSKKKMSQHVVETFKSNSEDENIFKSICGDDLKKKISQNVSKTFKSTSVDVHITGPFRNNKSW
jgi:hypothetical protein